LLKALVSRVNLRMHIRIVRFWRSMSDVLMASSRGAPTILIFCTLLTFGGL